jgi:hypothetical protein
MIELDWDDLELITRLARQTQRPKFFIGEFDDGCQFPGHPPKQVIHFSYRWKGGSQEIVVLIPRRSECASYVAWLTARREAKVTFLGAVVDAIESL